MRKPGTMLKKLPAACSEKPLFVITRRAVLIAGSIATLAGVKGALAESKEMNMNMDIKRNGSRPSTKGSSDWFTGSVRVDPLSQAPDPARTGAGQVTFEPGARTAWHTHPLGQSLIVTAGLGWVQQEGGPIE